MVRSVILAAALLAIAPAAWAQDCPDESQSGLTQCADAAYKKTDAALNATYKQIVARLKDDEATAKSLLAAQRAWIAYRDAECNFLTSGSQDGSVYPMLQAQCLDELTSKRVDDLKALLTCEEGDMSCPVPAP